MQEYIKIVSSWNYHTNHKQFNCKEQVEKMKNQPNSQQRILGFKERNGCDNKISKTPRQVYRNLNFHSCFCNHLDNSFNHYLDIHENYSKGYLPFTGGFLEQPNKVIEIINLISVLKYELEKKEHDKIKGKK